MPNEDEFDVIAWLKAHTNFADITRHNIGHVLDFSLMWNLFEEKACNKNCSIGGNNGLEALVNNLHNAGKLQREDFEPYLSYFVERYIADGQTNSRFNRLNFRPHDRKTLVADVLHGHSTDIYDTVLALLIIVYRYRNNLFHGEKAIDELPSQADNFKIANRLLALILDLSWNL